MKLALRIGYLFQGHASLANLRENIPSEKRYHKGGEVMKKLQKLTLKTFSAHAG
jgi:hypothetical protein